MRRLGLFNAVAALALLQPAGYGQNGVAREGGYWVRTFSGSAAAGTRLRVSAHGPVTVEGGVSRTLSYTVKVSLKTRSAAEARRVLERYTVQVTSRGGWTVVTVPGGPAVAGVSIRAPQLSAVEISTSDGAVQASGIEGPLNADTRAGGIHVDRVGGRCRLITGGGDIHVGTVQGALRCTTGAGHITVQTARGEAILETNGGDIAANDIGGAATAQTAGGSVHIGRAGGTVTAITGGGQIIIEKAGGIVTARNMAGPVRVGAAAGVHCESGSGAVQVRNISGAVKVSTSWGSIFASLAGGHAADSFLSTGNGDITVTIPSNLSVTVRAENEMADTLRRIISEFPGIPVRVQGTRVVAEGRVNGGGPMLRISDTGGTIFIKRQ